MLRTKPILLFPKFLFVWKEKETKTGRTDRFFESLGRWRGEGRGKGTGAIFATKRIWWAWILPPRRTRVQTPERILSYAGDPFHRARHGAPFGASVQRPWLLARGGANELRGSRFARNTWHLADATGCERDIGAILARKFEESRWNAKGWTKTFVVNLLGTLISRGNLKFDTRIFVLLRIHRIDYWLLYRREEIRESLTRVKNWGYLRKDIIKCGKEELESSFHLSIIEYCDIFVWIIRNVIRNKISWKWTGFIIVVIFKSYEVFTIQ